MPGRAQRLDQPVLEQQRAELGLRHLVVDVLGLGRPRRAGREVRARARAQVDRLADVQRPPVGVAEDVDARARAGAPARCGRSPRGRLTFGGRVRTLRAPSSASASPIVGAFAHRRPNSAQNTRAHVRASGSARWTSSTSTPSAAASVASPRRRCSGANRRASATVQITGGSGHSSAARANAWRSTRTSKRGVVGDQHAAAQQRGQPWQHVLGRRRGVDHRLRDPGEALDAAPERVRDADQRVPLVVQLAAADEHRPDLGQLAALAAEPVGLGVEGDELGGGEGLFEHGPRSIRARTGRCNGACSPRGALPFGPCAASVLLAPRRPRRLRRFPEPRENRLRPRRR